MAFSLWFKRFRYPVTTEKTVLGGKAVSFTRYRSPPIFSTTATADWSIFRPRSAPTKNFPVLVNRPLITSSLVKVSGPSVTQLSMSSRGRYASSSAAEFASISRFHRSRVSLILPANLFQKLWVDWTVRLQRVLVAYALARAVCELFIVIR